MRVLPTLGHTFLWNKPPHSLCRIQAGLKPCSLSTSYFLPHTLCYRKMDFMLFLALAPWFPTFGLNLGSFFWLESTPPPPAQWIWSWFQCCLLHQGLTDMLAKRLWTLSQLPPNPVCHFLHVSWGVPRVKFPQAPGWAETHVQACQLLGPTSDTTWSFFLKVGRVLACFIIRPSLLYCM